MSEVRYYSDPAIAGDRLAFVCDDAIWECHLSGGRALRLTSHFASIAAPQLEPGRGRIAYSAAREGPMQIHVQTHGDPRPRQLTNLAEPCRTLGWAADGRVAFSTTADTPFRQLSTGWLVDPNTGRLERLASGALLPCSRSHAAVVAFSPGVNPRYWRGYRGGAKGEIWIDSASTGVFRRIIPVTSNVSSPVLCRDRVYFVSDDTGHPNLFSCTLGGGDVQQHTHSDTYAVHSLASDGEHIVYCCAGDIVLFSCRDEPRPIDIALAGRVEGRRGRSWPVGKSLTNINGAPDGQTIVWCTMGTVFEWSLRKSIAKRLPRMDTCSWVGSLPGGALLVIAAGEGDDQILRVERNRRIRHRIVPAQGIGRIVEARVATDGRRVVLSNHRFEVLAVDLATGASCVLDRSDYRAVDQLDVSSDGTLCAYALPIGLHRTIVRLARCDSGEVIGETGPRFADISPRFLPDGSVAFLSLQRKPPAGNEMITTLNVWHSPYRPLTQCVVRLNAPHVFVSRAVPLFGGLALLRPTGDSPDIEPASNPSDPLPLWSVGADDLRSLGDAGFLVVTRDALHLGHHDNGRPIIEPALTALASVNARIDPRVRWRASVAEAWRVARDEVPEESLGPHWEVARDSYLRLVDRAGSPRDVVDIQNEMLGHLRMSHARVVRPRPATTQKQGLLGVEVECDDVAEGGWRIKRMPRVDPQAPIARGLGEPTLRIRAGDRLMAIDGEMLTTTRSPQSLLRGKGGREVRCDVVDATTGQRRTVMFESLESERPISYAAWVREREEVVVHRGGGRVAYLHLPDVTVETKARVMDWSWCHEETRALIVDVRFNEGGSYGGEIAEFFARPVIARVRTRWSAPRAIPAGSGIGPIVVLTNRFTTSGGELFAATLGGLTGARVIGEQTFGGAFGNTIPHRLPDGCDLLLPEIQVVTPAEWSHIENRGHAPDIHAPWCADERTPDRALMLALRELGVRDPEDGSASAMSGTDVRIPL